MSSRLVISLALVLILGACGFRLQGAATTPGEMQRTYIDAADEFSQFTRALRRELESVGVDVVDSPSDATATLTILFDDTGQRVLSVSARNVPTEFEVFYTVEYRLSAGETDLLAARPLTVTRDYTYDETRVLGKAREEQLLRDAIVEDLVRIVMKQLSAI